MISFEVDALGRVPRYIDSGVSHTVHVAWQVAGEEDPVTIGSAPYELAVSVSGSTPSSALVQPRSNIVLAPARPGVDVTVAVTFDGASFVTSAMRAALPSPRAVTAPVVVGVPQAGRILTCRPGRWPVEPEATTYHWLRQSIGSSEVFVHEGPRYQVRAVDRRLRIRCIAHATFRARRPADAPSATVVASLRPRTVVIVPVDRRGMSMACGATEVRPCRVRRGALLRFAIQSRPVQAVRSRWVVQVHHRGRWADGALGDHDLPSRYYIPLSTRGAPAGLYRVRASIGRRTIVDAGVSRWRFWRVG